MDNDTDLHPEEIHLPSPSIAPLIVALGMTFALVGLLSPSFLIAGLGILAVGIGIWAFTSE
ncbi:MAG: hypothetical protein P8Z40_12815 [Chloroflexota bacterium]|jgi:hypothetical protein